MDFHESYLIAGRGWELVRVGEIQRANGGAEDVELVYGWGVLEAKIRTKGRAFDRRVLLLDPLRWTCFDRLKPRMY